MMDDRKRCDGVGALFCVLGGWQRRQNSGIFLCFCLLRGARGPAAVEFVRIRWRRRRPTHVASDPGGWPNHTSNAVRLRAQAGFSTSHVSSRLVIRLLKRRYHKQIRDAALHFHETKKHVLANFIDEQAIRFNVTFACALVITRKSMISVLFVQCAASR